MPKSELHHLVTRMNSTAPAVENPSIFAQSGSYRLRMVQTEQDLHDVCRLRFEVFNLELGEGLQRSFQSGSDSDRFDRQCHHLMVEHHQSGVIGTYRLQVSETASGAEGFYSAREFDLQPLEQSILPNAVELGRACIAKNHRNRKVLFLLWTGLAQYAKHFNKRYFFGCNSLTSQDVVVAWKTFDWIRHHQYLHAEILAKATNRFLCPSPSAEETAAQRDIVVNGVPKLFAAYLRYGSKVCSEPALDRDFGTVDFLTLHDRSQLTPIQRARFRA